MHPRSRPETRAKMYPSYVGEMESLLGEFNPIGYREESIQCLPGPPAQHDDSRLAYLFEGGFGGVYWVFHFDTDVVSGVGRGSSS